MVFSKIFLVPILTLLTAFSGANNKDFTDTLSVRTYFNKYFEACNVSGCILIFDNNQKQWITNDSVLMRTEKLPASTFKILNLLIALETGVINDENELFKWNGEKDTVKYGFRPETYRDMTVKEAFETSVIWNACHEKTFYH